MKRNKKITEKRYVTGMIVKTTGTKRRSPLDPFLITFLRRTKEDIKIKKAKKPSGERKSSRKKPFPLVFNCL